LLRERLGIALAFWIATRQPPGISSPCPTLQAGLGPAPLAVRSGWMGLARATAEPGYGR